jgi:hypothetical protein
MKTLYGYGYNEKEGEAEVREVQAIVDHELVRVIVQCQYVPGVKAGWFVSGTNELQRWPAEA